jgi:hypothetical protein
MGNIIICDRQSFCLYSYKNKPTDCQISKLRSIKHEQFGGNSPLMICDVKTKECDNATTENRKIFAYTGISTEQSLMQACYLEKIKILQRAIRKYLKSLNRKHSKIRRDNSLFIGDYDSSIVPNSKQTQFSFIDFKTHIEAMGVEKSQVHLNEEEIENSCIHFLKLSKLKSKTSSYSQAALVRIKTLNNDVPNEIDDHDDNEKDNHNNNNANNKTKNIREGGSLTKYMKISQTSFKYKHNTKSNIKPSVVLKMSISPTSNMQPSSFELYGNFLKKRQKYKYQGNVNVQTSKKEGFGKIIWNDNSILLANFKCNRVHDIAYFHDFPTQTDFSGIYSHNKPSGYGIYKSSGVILEGEWDDQTLNGYGSEYSDNLTYYQGTFSNNMKNGIGLYRWNDGTIYKGEWENNQMTGYGIIIYKDDKIYCGQVNNGVMHGYGEFYWGSERKKYVGYYENDTKQGFGIYIWNLSPLQLYMGFWERGKMHGAGLVIKGTTFKYGIWKKGKNEMWLQGPWEYRKYLNMKDGKGNFYKFMETNQKKLLSFVETVLL